MDKRKLTNADLAEIKKRAKNVYLMEDVVTEDVPALLAEVERLRRELSFIANVDLTKNAYDIEHVSVSVKSWALNVLDGVNHDD